jgi:hypothetical protein
MAIDHSALWWPNEIAGFTHSVYVATYFAVEPCLECDAVIWAVNGSYITQRNVPDYVEKTSDDTNRVQLSLAEKILGDGCDTAGVLQVEPDRLNERMSVQKGVFLFPNDVKVSFLENLASAIEVDRTLLEVPETAQTPAIDFAEKIIANPDSYRAAKIVLSRRAHEDAIYDLAAMNIDASTLFPGLEGFARSLAHHLRMPAFVRYPELLARNAK